MIHYYAPKGTPCGGCLKPCGGTPYTGLGGQWICEDCFDRQVDQMEVAHRLHSTVAQGDSMANNSLRRELATYLDSVPDGSEGEVWRRDLVTKALTALGGRVTDNRPAAPVVTLDPPAVPPTVIAEAVPAISNVDVEQDAAAYAQNVDTDEQVVASAGDIPVDHIGEQGE